MANATVNLSLTTSGYVDSSRPYTVITTNTSTEYEVTESTKLMYFGMEKMPNALRHYVLVSASTTIAYKGYGVLRLIPAKSGFDSSTLTYNNKPALWDEYVSVRAGSDALVNITTSAATYRDYLSYLFRNNTFCVNASGAAGQYPSVKTVLTNGSTKPYYTITYDNATKVTSQIVYKSGAASGYYNPRNAASFTWDYEKVGTALCADETFDQSSAVFYWKNSTDESYTSVSVSGNTKGVTIPANTFPVNSTIQWYVSGTDEDNTTTQTEVFSFSTAAGTASSNCVDPVNQVIDGSADYTLRWTISSTDGQPASRTILQWKKSTDNTWTTIVDYAGQLTSYVVSGGTFPAGGIDWKVIPYNIDGVIGTSSTATFISVAAPQPVQGLAATPVPYSTISWQSSEQRAYRILVDGVEVVKAFGDSVYSYQLTEPLSDGTHEIAVLVQGQYGYWSQPSIVTVVIENVPDSPITLTDSEWIDVSLSWETESSTSNYYVYRDGKRVAHTLNTFFSDRLAVGNHSYYVINRLADGNYTKSNIVEASTYFDGAKISLLSGGDWMDITLTEKSATEQKYTYQRKYSSRHISGAVYPVVEMSSFEDLSGTYDCAFKTLEESKQFESFKGQTVIIKTRGDKIVIGAMVAFSSHFGDFLIGYSFSIQQIHVEDYVDDTNS